MSDDVIDALWARIGPDAYITREQFILALAEWDIKAIRIGPDGAPSHDGRLAFATITRGPEFHYATFGVGKLSLAMIRGWLAPILDRYGYVTSRTPKDEPRQHRVNLRLGATVTGEDEFFVHYRLER